MATGLRVGNLRIEVRLKLDFADIWRYVADRAYGSYAGERCSTRSILKSPPKPRLIPSEAKGFGPGAYHKGRWHAIYLRHRRRNSGMMVSRSSRNLLGFGSGHRRGRDGCALQNRARTGFVTAEGHAQPGSGRRSGRSTTIIPGLHHQGEDKRWRNLSA